MAVYVDGQKVGTVIINEDKTAYNNLVTRNITKLTTDDFEGITEIGPYAFAGCANLTSAEIPASVTTIGNNAFDLCSNLTNIIVGSTTINSSAFYNCSNLINVTLLEGVETLGINCFYNTGLTTLILPTSVVEMDNSCFWNVDNLSIYYNGSVNQFIEIEKSLPLGSNRGNTFDLYVNNQKVTSVTISPNDNFSFYACSNMSIESATIDNNTSSYMFQECLNLTTINFGTSIYSINNYTFYRCSSLQQINIPSNITSIDGSAFSNCTNLQQVTYGGQAPNILQDVFRNDNAVTKYDFRNCITIPTLYSTTSLGHASGCQIIIPDALYDEWIVATNWVALTDVNFVKASEYVE